MRWLLLLAFAALSACAAPSQLSRRDAARVAGQTYVITGASSGFGRGVALRLGRYRANVVLNARRAPLLEEVATAIRAAGGTAIVVPGDVTRPEDIDRLARAALDRYGRIDVWINNAGVAAIGAFEAVPAADHTRVIDVNVNGVIHGSHAALTVFKRQGWGTLVNIGSVESKIPLAYQSSYGASKHAVLALGEAIRHELRLADADRIKVSTVLPWAANTPIWAHMANHSGRETTMILLDPPSKVVDAIVWTSIHPRARVSVGWKAEAAAVADRLFPHLTARIAADVYHDVQIEGPPPAPPTSGNLHQPMWEGRDVVGEAPPN